MAAMASTSMNLMTTVVGLAKLQKTSFAGNHVPRMWRNLTFRHRGFATTSCSIHPPFAVVSLLRAKRLSRNLSVAATATPTEQDEDSDVLTKIPPDNRIPATIIIGFLGSGKTTLLNHILTADHGKRIAVIENEYGEVDIDGSLVAAKSVGVEDIVMLNNGCLCCTVRGDLVRMIGELVNKKKGKFDHIVIATTESKIQEAKSKKDTLKARAQSAKTAAKVTEMLGNVNTSSALSAFEKMEEKVMTMESQAEALNQLTTDELEGKFAMLETSSVDDDLEGLKRELSGTTKKGELPAGRTTNATSKAAYPFWEFCLVGTRWF